MNSRFDSLCNERGGYFALFETLLLYEPLGLYLKCKNFVNILLFSSKNNIYLMQK